MVKSAVGFCVVKVSALIGSLVILILSISACDDNFENVPLNSLMAVVNGERWLSEGMQAQMEVTAGNELRFTIVANGMGTEAIFIRVRSIESQVLGLHEFTTALGANFVGYRKQGAAISIETHTPFYCNEVVGSIRINEFSMQERFITGTFSARVCEQNGLNSIMISEGQFFRVQF